MTPRPSAPTGLPRVLPLGGEAGLEAHLSRWGPVACPPEHVIDEVRIAGLRGKGGGAFPTATKMTAVLGGKQQPVVVANGTEGEPASSKDKALLTSSPHLVIDGAVIAARSLGASEVIFCLKRSSTSTVQTLGRALAERARSSVDDCPVRLEVTPDGYLSGEESALVHWLNDGDPRPTFSSQRPYERGVRRRPTLIQNVETFAHLALIARYGGAWFRQVGTTADPGSTLLTLRGHVGRPGVYEVPLGASLSHAVRSADGQLEQASAVLIGGYFGTWVSASDARIADLSAESLQKVGASLGCGVVAVLAPKACGLAEVAAVTRWMASQSAKQCGPCTNGLPAMSAAIDALYAGAPVSASRDLQVLMQLVEGRGACRHPEGTVRFVRSALEVFDAEIEAHRRHGPCPRRPLVLPTPATPLAPRRSRR